MSAGIRGISDLGGLEYCSNLTALNLQRNQISDISALAGLTSLTTLHLDSNQISDISPLAGLTSLTTLYLQANQISGISSLAGLTNLNCLDLQQNQISNISPVAGLTNLTRLDLSSNEITDVGALAGLTNLTYLGLSSNDIRDISALAGLTNLTKLYGNQNQIGDISALAGLSNLWGLGLSDNRISDISALAGLANLMSLDLGNNQITDISALAGLTNLRYLHLNANQLSDISALAGLTTYLASLDLSSNQISDISALALVGWNNLMDLDLRSNPLSQDALCFDIPVLRARGVSYIYYDGTRVSQCNMFETLVAQGRTVAAAYGALLGLPTDYAAWDVEGWPVEPYGDGIPDLWQLRLFADAYCNEHHRLHETVVSVYEANLATLSAEAPGVPATLRTWAATTIGLGAGMRSALADAIGLDPNHYLVYQEPGKAATEPFSADGDCDGDGISNLEEYEYVVACGGDIESFVIAASENSPFWNGNPDLPAASVIGLALLAVSVCLGGSQLMTLKRLRRQPAQRPRKGS